VAHIDRSAKTKARKIKVAITIPKERAGGRKREDIEITSILFQVINHLSRDKNDLESGLKKNYHEQ
jgi:hypothetical protein